MNPLVVDLLEMLLRKGETVTMCISFHGNVFDARVTGVKQIEKMVRAQGGWVRNMSDIWQIDYEFDDGHLDQESDICVTVDELEHMRLRKHHAHNIWILT